jgi:hypothetical protein
MTDCERLREDAPGLLALPQGDPARAAAFAHAAGCPGCARALREAERLQAMLDALEPSALPVGALTRAAAAIEAELVRERRRRAGWGALAAAAATAVLVGLARHRAGTGLDWALAAALAAAGVALSALSVRLPLGVLGGAAVATGLAALLAGGEGQLQAEMGLHCLVTELACAGAVVWAGWMALRGGTTRPARRAVAAAAAAGALAGAGALQVTCGAHGVALHLLAFHAGGVVLAAAAAALLWRPRRIAAAA